MYVEIRKLEQPHPILEKKMLKKIVEKISDKKLLYQVKWWLNRKSFFSPFFYWISRVKRILFKDELLSLQSGISKQLSKHWYIPTPAGGVSQIKLREGWEKHAISGIRIPNFYVRFFWKTKKKIQNWIWDTAIWGAVLESDSRNRILNVIFFITF